MKIIANRKMWYWISGTLIAASLLSVVFWQFKFGIDFTGGSLIEVVFDDGRPSIAEVTEALAPFGAASVQPAGEQGMIIRMPPLDQTTHLNLVNVLNDRFAKVTEQRFDSIGPTIGVELRNKALVALLIMFVAIIIYIAYAFRRVSRPISSWVYGVITMITAFHDIAIPLGIFSLLGKFASVEVGAAFVAAILTIMGYSINDTIVVLDRVRENLARGSGTFEDIVEKSVRQTITRSVITGVGALLALIAIYFFGGESIKYFALALIVGIAVGAYSSLFIAAPLLVTWQKHKSRRR